MSNGVVHYEYWPSYFWKLVCELAWSLHATSMLRATPLQRVRGVLKRFPASFQAFTCNSQYSRCKRARMLAVPATKYFKKLTHELPASACILHASDCKPVGNDHKTSYIKYTTVMSRCMLYCSIFDLSHCRSPQCYAGDHGQGSP